MAFVDGDRRLTYAEWDWLSDRAAFNLSSEGIRAGDVVAVLLEPGITYPVAVVGAAKLGAIAAGINPRLAQPEIDSLLDLSLARALVTDRSLRSEPRLFDPERLLRPGAAPPRVQVADGEPAMLVFTGGTTGTPKAATFTGRALRAVARIERAHGAGAPGPRLQAVPLPQVQFMTKIAHLVERDGPVVILPRWDATGALEAIARERVTSLAAVGAQLERLLRADLRAHDLRSLREITVGGAPVTPGLIGRLTQAFPKAAISVRYSCTELAMVTATAAADSDEVLAETVGRPLPEVDLRLDPPEGVGEVLARSPAMMSGYWRDPAATSAAVTADGFFRTGDLGRVDGSGNLRLVGRRKDVYIRGGYNVFPAEVESALRAHPAVADAAVVGVPDEVLGERGVAFVVPRAEAPAPGELRAFLAGRLASYKLPDRIELRRELPHTAMHKVDRRALAQDAIEH